MSDQAGHDPLELPWHIERMQPTQSDEGTPFWEATREQRLVLQWCSSCERPIHYPRARCPWCGGDALEFRASSGRGTVYAVTVEHRPQNPAFRPVTPYAVALVDLDEGVRLLTNIVGVPAHEVAVGDRVSLTWEPLSDGRNLPLFTPHHRGPES